MSRRPASEGGTGRRWTGSTADRFDGAVDDVRLDTTAEAADKFAELAAPLAPAITLPDETTAPEGIQLRVIFDAGGGVHPPSGEPTRRWWVRVTVGGPAGWVAYPPDPIPPAGRTAR